MEKDLSDIIIYNCFSNNMLDDLEYYGIGYREAKERYEWLKMMDIDPNEIHLEESHKIIYRIFDSYNKMLNDNNIEYYYTSGILSYLLVGKELERYHHDLDIFINMKDLEKLESICGNYGFSFRRVLGDRGDGTKRVMLKMYYEEFPEIPITVFMYVLEKDHSITQKDYYYDLDGNRKIVNMYNSKEIVDYSFIDKDNYHNGIRYRAISLEALYLSKMGNRKKDIYDCNIFREYVDKERLERLKEAFRRNKKNEVIDSQEDQYSDYIFSKYEKEKVLRLS